MVSFRIMNKNEFENNAAYIFSILSTNMTDIAPTGNTYEEDFYCWKKAVSDGLKRPERNIILIINEELLIGFFQYCVNISTFIMEEI